MSVDVKVCDFEPLADEVRAENNDLIRARFDCCVGPVKLYGCTLRSSPKGLRVKPPPDVRVAWGVLTEMRNQARAKLDGSPEGD